MISSLDSVLDERAKKTFSHLRHTLLLSSMSEKNIKKKTKKAKVFNEAFDKLKCGLRYAYARCLITADFEPKMS